MPLNLNGQFPVGCFPLVARHYARVGFNLSACERCVRASVLGYLAPLEFLVGHHCPAVQCSGNVRGPDDGLGFAIPRADTTSGADEGRRLLRDYFVLGAAKHILDGSH